MLWSSSAINSYIFREFTAALCKTAYIWSLLALCTFSFSRDSKCSGFELHIDSLKKLAVFNGLKRAFDGERIGDTDYCDARNRFSGILNFYILCPSLKISLFKSSASVIALLSSLRSVESPCIARSGVSMKGTSFVIVLLSRPRLLSARSS